MKQLCLKCQKNPAIKDPTLGYLLCVDCRTNVQISAQLPYEFAQESVKQSRKEYADDLIQSSRDGVLSRERLDKYGTRGLKVTEEQIKNARYVWDDRESLAYNKGTPKLI